MTATAPVAANTIANIVGAAQRARTWRDEAIDLAGDYMDQGNTTLSLAVWTAQNGYEAAQHAANAAKMLQGVQTENAAKMLAHLAAAADEAEKAACKALEIVMAEKA